MTLSSMSHTHMWSDHSHYAHCMLCGLSHRAYLEWLEERIAKPLAAVSWLSENGERLAQLAAEARRYAIGSRWPNDVRPLPGEVNG